MVILQVVLFLISLAVIGLAMLVFYVLTQSWWAASAIMAFFAWGAWMNERWKRRTSESGDSPERRG